MIKFKKFSKGFDNVVESDVDNCKDVDVLIQELDQQIAIDQTIEMEPEVTVEELVVRNQEELDNAAKDLDIVQKDEIDASKFLTGNPEMFILGSDVTKRMIRHGLASDMGDGKLARGFLWSVYN